MTNQTIPDVEIKKLWSPAARFFAGKYNLSVQNLARACNDWENHHQIPEATEVFGAFLGFSNARKQLLRAARWSVSGDRKRIEKSMDEATEFLTARHGQTIQTEVSRGVEICKAQLETLKQLAQLRILQDKLERPFIFGPAFRHG